jgi:hypothetical protein
MQILPYYFFSLIYFCPPPQIAQQSTPDHWGYVTILAPGKLMSKKPSELLKCPPRATRLQYKIYQNLLDSNSSVCGFDSSA